MSLVALVDEVNDKATAVCEPIYAVDRVEDGFRMAFHNIIAFTSVDTRKSFVSILCGAISYSKPSICLSNDLVVVHVIACDCC